MPKNIIEYVFEGNVLNLEQAIKRVESLLRSSVRAMKKYQNGTLNEEQKAQVKSTRALLRQLRAQRDLKRGATEEEIRRTNLAGKQALKNAAALQRESLRITKKGLKAQQQAQAAAASTATQERARQQAFFLGSYSEQLKSFISHDAYADIHKAVDEFDAAQKAFAAGKINQDEFTESVNRVNAAYQAYSSTLRTAKNAQQAAGRGVQDLKTLMASLEAQIQMTTQSVYFWINMLRRTAQAVKEGVTLYADYVESINFLQRAADDAAHSMSEFADAQIRAFGLNPTDVNTSAAIFYSFADSMGFANEQSELLSQNMTKLAQDIASLQNIDLETASVKLRSALAGQSRALATLGVNVNDANIEEWLLTKGMNKSMKQMNESSQAAARYAFILEKTAAAHGDLARTINSPANQIKVLGVQLKLLLQNVGTISTTLFLPLIKMLNQILLPINAFVRALTSTSASGFSSSIGDAASEVDSLTDSIKEADAAVNDLTGLDEINQFQPNDVNQTLGVDVDIAGLMQDYDNLANAASPLVPIFEALGRTLAPIWDMFGNDTNFSLLTGVLQGLSYALWPVQKLLEGISWLLDKLPKPIRDVVGLISEAFLSLVSLSAVLALVKTAMSSKVFVTFATTFKQIGSAILDAIKVSIQWLATAAKMIASAVATGIKNLWEAGTWWAKALAIVAAAGAGALAVAAVVGAGVATVKTIQASSTDANSVPQLAAGGVATGPTFALIGEGAYDEAVMPLGNSPQFESMKHDIAEEVRRGSSGQSGRAGTPIILNLNGREVARGLMPDISAARPQSGVKIK